MLTIVKWSTTYGPVILSAPRGNDYAWRTGLGARVSAYVKTPAEATRALARLSN